MRILNVKEDVTPELKDTIYLMVRARIIAKTEDCFEKLHDEQKIGQQFFDVHGFLHQKAAKDIFFESP